MRSLSLTGCGLQGDMLKQLGACLAPTQLWGIGVSNNPDVDLAAWVEFWSQLPPTIKKFDFGDNGLKDEALPKLMCTLTRGQVEQLLLDGNCFSSLTPLLPILAESFGLTELDIGDNNISDPAGLELAQALPSSALTTLVLGRNGLGDGGAVPLARALPQTKIQILHLDSTQIGDSTLDALVSALAGSRLTELHIDETKVTDAGVLRLCRALPQSRVALLDASENNLSDETVAAIEAALPSDIGVE